MVSQGRAASARRVARLVWIGPSSSTRITGRPTRPGAGPYSRPSRRSRFTRSPDRSVPPVVTTVLDPAAARLAALYHERWAIEGALAELKTRPRGARVVLRSKTPELARQEFRGLPLARFAIHGLRHEAALRADEGPDRLSFPHAARAVQRKPPLLAALPPRARAALREAVPAEIPEERVASGRGRARGVKRKTSG